MHRRPLFREIQKLRNEAICTFLLLRVRKRYLIGCQITPRRSRPAPDHLAPAGLSAALSGKDDQVNRLAARHARLGISDAGKTITWKIPASPDPARRTFIGNYKLLQVYCFQNMTQLNHRIIR